MKAKKVFVAHSWTDVAVNIQTKAVARRLSELYEVLFISQARIGSPAIKVNDRLCVVEWPNKRPNSVKDFLFICGRILKEKPEALIVHFGATNVCMIAAWLLGVKHRICWMHTLSQQYYLDATDPNLARKNVNKRKRIYRLATNVIVLNEYGRRDAKDGYDIPEKKIYKIYNGIYPIPVGNVQMTGIKSIRYIGRLDKSKGVDIVLRAFAELAKVRNDVRLDLAGSGTEMEAVKTWIAESGLSDRISYHGYFTDYEQSRKFISEAYCLVVPSRIDNFPSVILEAMSAAVPVIASDIAGIPDMIENGKDGFLIEVDNAAAFRDAMQKLVDNVALRTKLSQQAQANFDAKFSMDRHVENVAGFVNGLLKDETGI